MVVDGREIDRFWSKVQIGQPDECWLWLGAKSKFGYGLFSVREENSPAPRAAWIFANNRDISDGLCIRHSCDNLPCCNPAHLSIGTHQDNMRDRYSRPGATKLSADDVREIFRLDREGCRVADIAVRFGMRRRYIYQILAGKCWKWLEIEP